MFEQIFDESAASAEGVIESGMDGLIGSSDGPSDEGARAVGGEVLEVSEDDSGGVGAADEEGMAVCEAVAV